jgi:hypothetical protein
MKIRRKLWRKIGQGEEDKIRKTSKERKYVVKEKINRQREINIR